MTTEPTLIPASEVEQGDQLTQPDRPGRTVTVLNTEPRPHGATWIRYRQTDPDGATVIRSHTLDRDTDVLADRATDPTR